METFTDLKPLVNKPNYLEQRKNYLDKLDIKIIDEPINKIIKRLTELSYCFTLQSCYGHFVHAKQKNTKNVEPLSCLDNISIVEYRIAYIALCIQNNDYGKRLLFCS